MAKTAAKESVTAADVRAWAQSKGLIGEGVRTGRISAEVTAAYNKAHKTKEFGGSPYRHESTATPEAEAETTEETE